MKYAIPGTDLDFSDLDSLDIGSSLLLEVDGVDCNPGDLASVENIASVDWSIFKRDDDSFLVLNSLFDKKVVLNKSNMISKDPAVFEIPLILGSELKVATVIPKMVAYYLENKSFVSYLEEQSRYKQFAKFTNNESGIKYALSFIWNRIRNLEQSGWGINSINRFALKSNVDINIVAFIQKNNYEDIVGSNVIDLEDIKGLFESTFRYHMWHEQAKETGITGTVINLPSWKDRK